MTHDARGNIASEGGRTFGYSSENLLSNVAALSWTQTYGYDPLLRFAATTGGGLPRSHAYDGDDMLVTNLSGQFLTRFVHGPGESEPLYHLDNQGRRYWYHADERGSIVAASDSTGAAWRASSTAGPVWPRGLGRDNVGRTMRHAATALSALAAACASGGAVQFAAPSEYALNISPDVARGAFAVELVSRSSRPLCISFGIWPQGGQVAHPVRMTVDGREYESEIENFGYCIGPSCPHRIAPGGRLQSFISFSEFPAWDPAMDMSRAQLDFSVRPWRCRG